MDPVDTRGLSPVLARLPAPWMRVIEISGPGMGESLAATAAPAVIRLRRRIVVTPALDCALIAARAATDILGRHRRAAGPRSLI